MVRPARTRMRCRTPRSSKKTVRTSLRELTSCGRFAASILASRAESICTLVTAKSWSNIIPRRPTPDWPNDEGIRYVNKDVGLASEARSTERKAMIQQIEASPDEIYDIE